MNSLELHPAGFNLLSTSTLVVGILLGAMLLLTAYRIWPSQIEGLLNRVLRASPTALLSVGGIGVILACMASVFFGELEFAGYDPSPMIQAAWRVLIGDVLGRDFICTFPPISYLPTVLGFREFGVCWSSILVTAALMCLACCAGGVRVLWLVRYATHRSRWNAALLTYLGLQAVLLLVVNFTWHSTLTAAFNCYLALITLGLLSELDIPRRRRTELWIHYILVCALLLLSKPNTAYPAMALSVLCLVGSTRKLRSLLALLASAAITTGIIFPFRISMLSIWQGYVGLTGRIVPAWSVAFEGLIGGFHLYWGLVFLISYLLVAGAVVAAVRAIHSEYRVNSNHWPLTFVVCMGIICLYGLFTNRDIKFTDVSPFLCSAITAAIWFRTDTEKLSREMLFTMTLVLMASLMACAARWRMVMAGSWAGSDFGPRIRMHDRFFDHFEGREKLLDVLVEVDDALSRHPGSSVFFGPRMEFLYARNQVHPPKNMPVWWDKGASYSLGSESELVSSFRTDRPDLVILDKPNLPFLPVGIMDYIHKSYRELPGYDDIDVYEIRR